MVPGVRGDDASQEAGPSSLALSSGGFSRACGMW